jgi:hypothetical protein
VLVLVLVLELLRMTMRATSKAVSQSLLKRPQPVRAGHELGSHDRRRGHGEKKQGTPNCTPGSIHHCDRNGV